MLFAIERRFTGTCICFIKSFCNTFLNPTAERLKRQNLHPSKRSCLKRLFPIWGLSAPILPPLNKKGIDCSEQLFSHINRSQFQCGKVYERNSQSTLGRQGMSEAKLKLKGIFFDLDGTIVDSRQAYIEAARTAFQALGKEPPDAKTALEIPRRLERNQPISNLVNDNTKKFLDVYLRTYYSITKEKTKPFPNVSTTLKTLSKKTKLALITMRSVPKQTVTAELKHFSIAKYFTHIVTALDTANPKPSPEALIKTVQAMDIQICDCTIVGDSISDIKAGKAAGTKTIAVLSGLFSQTELAKQYPDLILKDVTALPKHIA
jgi:HAD superfamily hydrolase (TIGR01509 family)